MKDYRYGAGAILSLNATHVSEFVGKKDQSYTFTISNITQTDDGAIRVDFDDNDYTIYSGGLPVWRTPEFSHAETIGVNQTFVVICDDFGSEASEDSKYYDTTSVVIYQYRGIEELEVTSVTRFDYDNGGASGGGVTHELPHPKTIPVHKFLFMSAYTNTKMPCDYPQVIEHTVDAKKIGPADTRAVDDRLYQWYK